MEDSLNKRYIIKLSSSIISGGVNAGILALVPNSLGPVLFGNYTYLVQVFTQLIAFLDAGTSTALFTKLSAEGDKNKLLLFYLLIIALVLFSVNIIVAFIGFFKLGPYFSNEASIHEIYFGALLCFFTWLSQVTIKISDSYALTSSVEIVKILYRILSLLMLYLLIKFSYLDVYVFYIFNIVSVVIFIFGVCVVLYRGGVFSLDIFKENINIKDNSVSFAKFCVPLLQFNVAGIVIGIFDIWLLQYTSGASETGFYGLSYSIAALSIIFTSSMTPVISREFAKSYGNGDLVKLGNLFNAYTPVLYLIAIFVGVYLSFSSDFVISVFSDERYLDAKWSLLILALYPAHQTYGQLSSSVMFAMEETNLYKNIGLFFSFIGMLFSVVFIYIMDLGALGLAMKMVLVQLVSVNVQLWYTARFLNLDFKKYLVSQVFPIAIFYFVCIATSVVDIENELFNFLISGFLYLIVSLTLVLFFPKLFLIDETPINKIKLLIKLRVLNV
ncbi:lipopolysaccharide biosynthesis protein [Vibrio tubiashii]|uniref:lipopolysaccharide biosynthesis protein n=1 Tax=Vibrio tubiashii TaxID=29498 RepID=UPI00349E8871